MFQKCKSIGAMNYCRLQIEYIWHISPDCTQKHIIWRSTVKVFDKGEMANEGNSWDEAANYQSRYLVRMHGSSVWCIVWTPIRNQMLAAICDKSGMWTTAFYILRYSFRLCNGSRDLQLLWRYTLQIPFLTMDTLLKKILKYWYGATIGHRLGRMEGRTNFRQTWR